MPTDIVFYFCLIFGIIFITGEFIFPGLALLFLGLASLAVAFMLYMQWLTGWTEMLITWFSISAFIIYLLRNTISKRFSGTQTKSDIDEDREAHGAVVEVLSDVSCSDSHGRISYRGTSWNARSLDRPLLKGEKAELVKREINHWLIKKK